MNRVQVATLVEELRKSPEKATLHRKLVRIRTDVINTEAGLLSFVAADGVPLLVGLLTKRA